MVIEPFDFENQEHDEMHDWVRDLVIATLPVSRECMDRVIDEGGESGTLYFRNGFTVVYTIDHENGIIDTEVKATEEAIMNSLDHALETFRHLHPEIDEDEIEEAFEKFIQGGDLE